MNISQSEVGIMAVSYKKLFKMLIDRNMKKKEFREVTGLSYSTISKLENGDNVTMNVIENICLKMNCVADDILEFIPDSAERKGA